MSAWRLLLRELHDAGGSKPVRTLWAPLPALEAARTLGLVARAGGPAASSKAPPARLTPRGWDVAEGRLQKIDARLGRRWQATWLAALPRENEVRLTGAVHRAQDDGSCYW